MNDFIRENAWSITLIVAGIVASYAVTAYRIGRVEADVSEMRGQIGVISQVAVDVAILRERSENQTKQIEDIGENVDALIEAFKIKTNP